MARDFIKKTWYITGKGYFDETLTDSATGGEYTDLTRGIGYMMFTGTESELNDLLLTFSDDEFKVRGVFEYKSSEYYMYLYGVNYDITKDDNYKATN
tara:strand:- start:198 stop:488 length:291 start_codon:yes stop_codon:yes gene_type:complete